MRSAGREASRSNDVAATPASVGPVPADARTPRALLRLARGARECAAGDLAALAPGAPPPLLALADAPRARPQLPATLQRLIIGKARDNPSWGKERIAAEVLLKLGMHVSPRTVRRYMGRGTDDRGGLSDLPDRRRDAATQCGWLQPPRLFRPRRLAMRGAVQSLSQTPNGLRPARVWSWKNVYIGGVPRGIRFIYTSREAFSFPDQVAV